MVRLLEPLVLPPLGPLLLILAGLVVRRRWRGLGRALLGLGIGLLVLLSIPAVGGALLCSLQRDPPVRLEEGIAAEAVVVLSADTDPRAPEYGGAGLGAWTLQRLRYGAFLQRRTRLPMLVTGGPGRFGLEPLAAIMARVAEQELGAEVRWVEDVSGDTFENASLSTPLLRAAGVQRIYLVTHAWHMPRARACFESQGLAVVPAPIGFRGPPVEGWRSLVPSWTGYRDSALAMHEWLGYAYYGVAVLP